MTQDDFDELLLWLGQDAKGTEPPDRERGARKYEMIRERIIKIYRNRGSRHAEEIADETISRVCSKGRKLKLTYEGDPALYFYGVAKYVYREYSADHQITLPTPVARDAPEEIERRHACLERCLAGLKPESRALILRFYEGEKGEKIENRKRLAASLNINTKTLSLRALRIRRDLRECVEACMECRK